MSGSTSRQVLPAGLAASITNRRVSPETLQSGRYVTDRDLYDFDDVDRNNKWDEMVISVYLVCSWSVIDPPVPTQIAPYSPSGPVPAAFGAAGRPFPQGAGSAPPGRVTVSPGWTAQMTQNPYSLGLAPAVQATAASPYTSGVQPMFPPGQSYGQAVPTHPTPATSSVPMTGGPYAQNPTPSPHGGWPIPSVRGMPGGRQPPVGPPTDEPVSFHFRLFFQLASGGSVELHEQNLGMINNKAIALWRTYVVTDKNVFDSIKILTNQPFPLHVVRTILFQTKRHQYRFVGGKGCAYWSLKVTHDLEVERHLQHGAERYSKDFYRRCAQRRGKPDELAPEPVRGVFFQ
ncbi:hypothetical protein L226DRAFT_534330 [Lentinus tigrinus ALCF2SS1-7]|uniref:uncharacterized protein n=1 Tax=Lentinus tigrinus ALCF2SS1-7 TaxID=1328758 RepID=UPI0011662062|nr:hypothetical protein L226DRAFT_534330 [Lentinus tigrinus ALCF2SS1-7]